MKPSVLGFCAVVALVYGVWAWSFMEISPVDHDKNRTIASRSGRESETETPKLPDGWRWLKVGEEIKKGDLVWSDHWFCKGGWREYRNQIGRIFGLTDRTQAMFAIRRIES